MTAANPFDRPVWASLAYTTALAEGSDQAKRYRRDINLFASARDDINDASVAALRGGVVCTPGGWVMPQRRCGPADQWPLAAGSGSAGEARPSFCTKLSVVT